MLVGNVHGGFPPALTRVEANIAVTGDPNRRQQVEPTVSIDPSNPGIIVAGAQDLRGVPDFGDRWHGYYRSADGGATWTNSLMPGYPTDASPEGIASPIHGADFTSDPVLAFDRLGNVYYSGLHVWDLTTSRDGVFVAKYRDSGASYETTVIVYDQPGIFSDKNWIAADRTDSQFSGNVYVAWSACCPGPLFEEVVMFSRSVDHGLTYSAPVTIQPVSQTDAIGVQVGVSVDGNVYVSWVAYPHIGEDARIYIARSEDGGASFSAPILVQNIVPVPSPLPGNQYRTFTLHAMTAGKSPGEVLVVWEEWVNRGTVSDSDVFIVKSLDGGETWAARKIVNDSTLNNQFFPAISSSGKSVNIVFYDSRNDPEGKLLDVYYAQSTDGGESFQANSRVTSQSFDPNIVPRTVNPGADQPFMGDYIAIASTSTFAYPVWADNRNVDLQAGNNAGRYDQDIFGSRLVPDLSEEFRFDWTDYDNDGVVTVVDIASAAFVFDQPDSYWDFDLNGLVDINDVAGAAIRFDHTWESVGIPGMGRPAGQLDGSWPGLCGQLPLMDRAYCESIP